MPQRPFAPRHTRCVLGALLLCSMLGGMPARARAQPRGPVESGQALMALLPFRLTEAEAPNGYALYDETATPNVALAFTAAPEERAALLRGLRESGRVAGLQQTFVPRAPANASLARLLVALYRDPAAAATAVDTTAPPGGAQSEPLAGPPLGDHDRAMTVTTSGRTDQILVVWSVGPILLAVTMQGPDADAARAFRFAETAQSHAAATPAPADLAVASLAGGDDDRQLAVAAAVEAAQLPAAAPPSPFQRGGEYLWSNEQIVLDARRPEVTAQLLSSEWLRVVATAQYFTTSDASRAVLTSAIAVFGDAAGAQQAVEEISLGPTARQAVLPLAPPLHLGEETLAYKSVLIWPRGEIRDSYTVQWRRNNAVLSVTVNLPPTKETPPYLEAVAAALDSAFEAAAPAIAP